MALTEAYSGTNATWSTEYSLTNSSTTLATKTTDGIYQVLLDLNALAIGDVYEFRCYEKVRSVDTQRVAFINTFSHSQGVDGAIWVSSAIQLMNGWDFSLKKTAGSDRTITWSVRAVT